MEHHPAEIASELSGPQRAVLLDLALLINDRRKVGDVYGQFLERMGEAAAYDFSALLSIDADGGEMRVLGRFPNWDESVPVGGALPPGAAPPSWFQAGNDGVEFVPTELGDTEIERRLASRGLGYAWGATLSVGDVPAGLLIFARRAWAPAADVIFFRAAGSLLAAALAQDALLRQAERSVVRGQLLHELSVLLNAGQPVATLFERMLELIERAIPLDYMVLAAAGQDDAFEVLGSRPPGVVPSGQLFELGTVGREQVWLSEEGVLDFEAAANNGRWGAYFKGIGVARALVCALREGGQPVGMLIVGRSAAAGFAADEHEFARRLAMILGQAIANERRIARSHAAAARARALNELAVLLNDGETVEALFDRLVALLEGALEFDYVGIGALTDASHLRLIGARPALLGLVGSEIDVGEAAITTIASAPGVASYATALLQSPAAAAFAAAGMARGATAALRDGNEMLGSFSVARKRDEAYSAEDLEFVRILGALLGQSMASHRRTERARAESARNRLLNEVALLVNSGEPPSQFFDQLCELLTEALPFESMALLLPEPDGHTMRVIGSLRSNTLKPGDVVPVSAAGLDPAASGNAVTEYLACEMESPLARAAAASGVARIAVATMRDGTRLGGILALGRTANRPFVPSECELLNLLATYLGQSLANERRLEETRLQGARSLLLSEAAVLLNDGKPTEDVFARVVDLMRPILAWDRCSLLLRDAVSGDFIVKTSIPGTSIPPGNVIPFASIPVSAERWATEPSLLYRPTEMPEEITGRLVKEGAVWILSGALRDGDRVLGLMNISRDTDDRFSPADVALFEFVATLLARAVAAEQRLAASEAEAARALLLNQLGLLLNAGEDVEKLFDRLPEMLRRAIEFNYVGIAVEAGRPGYLKAIDWNSRQPTNAEPKWLTSESVGMDGVLSNPGTVFQFEVEEELAAAGTLASQFAEAGIRRSAIAILGTPERRLGILHMARTNAERFLEEEMAFLEVVATFFSQAVGNQLRILESDAEAEEQGVIADVAAAAAAETDPGALVGALQALRRLIPRPFAAFGYLEGDELAYPSPSGEVTRWPMDRQSYRALQSGQVSGDELPEDLPKHSMLWSSGVHALTHTVARSGGEAVGFLLVGSREPGFVFEERELRILRVIAQIVGPAMENARAVERTRIEAQEQRILAEVAAVAARETEPGKLLNGLVEPLRALVPRPFVAYGHLVGPEVDWTGPAGFARRALTDLAKSALEHGQASGGPAPSHPDDVKSPVLLTYLSYTTALSGGVPLGLLYIATHTPGHTFGERELRLFKLIAQIIGPAMENARSATRTQFEAAEQRLLAEAASAAARGSTIAEIVEALPAALAAFVPGAFALYGRLSDGGIIYDTVAPEVAALVGAEELHLPLSVVGRQARDEGHGQGSLSWAHSDQVPGRWADPSDSRLETMRRISRALSLQQYCLLPYYASGAPVGMLMIASTEERYVFSPTHISLLSRVAQIVGPAIEAVRAAANIARQGELYDLILRSLTEGVILLDGHANLVFGNAFGTRLFEALNPGGVAATLAELIPFVPVAAQENFGRSVNFGEATRGRSRLLLEGNERWVDYEVVPLDGELSKLLIVTSDVTAAVRRETERQAQRDQLAQASRLLALGELIGGVAHELNNPLTAVLGFSEILAQSPAAESLSEEIGIIRKEALRASNIVRDLLFIARPAPVEQAEVRLTDVVGHIERLRHAAWLRAGIAVEIEIDDDACRIWGNEHQLAQVLLNLVTNAEHALEGGGSIHIGGRWTGSEVEITVRDTGAGMRAEVAQRVFEPFFTTKQAAGTGLGLSLSRTIVISHGGTISVHSKPGVGSTFTVTLPRHVPDFAETPALPVPPAGGPVRVLVVDDEPSLRKVCQRLVISMGHECAVAEGSASAVALAAQDDFEVVLCDYRLASETAAAVIAGFAEHAPHLVQRTVIATGATTDAGVVDLTTRFGLRLLAKPYGGDELAGIIADAYSRRA